jgi:hypothetical protein
MGTKIDAILLELNDDEAIFVAGAVLRLVAKRHGGSPVEEFLVPEAEAVELGMRLLTRLAERAETLGDEDIKEHLHHAVEMAEQVVRGGRPLTFKEDDAQTASKEERYH